MTNFVGAVPTKTNFVGAVLLLSCMLWTQIALKKELGTCIPTVLQVNKKILLNAVRIQWNYNNRVLLIPTTMYINVYTRIYTLVHQHLMNNGIPLD